VRTKWDDGDVEILEEGDDEEVEEVDEEDEDERAEALAANAELREKMRRKLWT
jgi:acylphosphatase